MAYVDPGNVAASMPGATVMPHAVYLHSSLVNDHNGRTPDTTRLLRVTRIDTAWAPAWRGW